MTRITQLLTLLLCTCAPALLLAQDLNETYWKALAPRSLGPAGMSGRVTGIDVHPQDRDLIYVATASGGLWKSTNGGTSFAPIFDDQKYLSIGAVAVSDANPSIIWAGTGEGNPRNSANYGGGIYRSLDGGATWEMMGLEDTRHIHRILTHPTDPNTVYVGAMGSMWGPNPERGVYRTTDGGKNWERVLYVDEGTGIADFVMDPSNPDKLIAATWTFDRDPWFFNSGGPGSGIWISKDGGDNWERRTAKHGLPKGNLGRIGLAIAASNPDIVYALVEAKENGLYKSTDGGQSFSLVTTKDVGDRPFYYAEIYVDPQNPNRVFHIATYISKSDDGGKTFREIANYGNNVHPDNHAFWIDEDNPEHIIQGNDGGLNFSHDGGETWRFAANLPLAQFYHINYDMSYPYLIGGGMQDNGSWVGPSQALKSGGVTDADWQEVYFGDGFDIIFKPDEADVVYAASQGGALGKVDRSTGKTTFIRPVHPEGEFLRFNWNAPIAQSPRDPNTIYMGSQYVHKSTNAGLSWEIISPDLTTNDSTKQRQDISGGLTIDATQAENHTTLLAIVPAPPQFMQPQTLWVSSDDGRLHISRNDGEEWTELTSKLTGMNPGSWIPYIEASPINPGEAFVVVNDYRRGDYRPMVYHTTNYGESFTRIVDENKVSGHAQAIVQDPVQENLLFLGTDQGLWYSLDYGDSWTRFDAGFPHVSTRDLKIHPREHDLIIATFGRAAWILDDIRPFREMAREGAEILQDSFRLFPAPDAYAWETRSYQGTRFYAQGQFQGEDRPGGAMLTYWVRPGGPGEMVDPDSVDVSQLTRFSIIDPEIKEDIPGRETGSLRKAFANPDDEVDPIPAPKEKVKIQVIDVQTGDTIRTYTEKPRWGMNRTSWNLRRDGVETPSRRERKEDADALNGISVTPGTYRILMTYGDHTGETLVTLHADPRDDYQGSARYAARDRMYAELEAEVNQVTAAWNRLQEARKSLKRVEDAASNAPKAVKDTLADHRKELLKHIDRLEEIVTEPEDLKGIQRNPTNLQAYLYGARNYITQIEGEPSQMARLMLEQFSEKGDDFVRQVNAFLTGDLRDFQEEVRAANLSLFGELGEVKE
ncbi:photosystem II stability/assembly factor-like uncharacterized protein [Lewinella marina]|uniref:Sortilin N-terminal domain-containing protein n=1 Tax=Neolewinella marina TaxID=438751 RepID=A0A2G0CBP3_9BACT|nr:hypothetical protein [Neolewinella marina]NJB87093.1 photosystem II stability/assembly factor-like uncharacterized protein [Neolewinella marina]PHK97376.1 hypothetical protein CGL56_16355 [Neolewinella marina]